MTVLAIGCGDSLSPHQRASALARHIDSLVVAARSNHRDSLWAVYLEGAESVPAYGGTPSSVVVTTRSGTQTWQGYVLTELSPLPDTVYVFWAYSDESFTHFVAALLQHNPQFVSGPSVYWVSVDSLVMTGAIEMNASIASVTDACSFTTGLQNYPKPPAGSCALGTFTVQLKASFPSGLDTLTLGPQTVNGALLQ